MVVVQSADLPPPLVTVEERVAEILTGAVLYEDYVIQIGVLFP